jgi:hypothetical protein
VDPVADIGVINTELILADLETVIKRLEKTKKNDPTTATEYATMEKLKNALKQG